MGLTTPAVTLGLGYPPGNQEGMWWSPKSHGIHEPHLWLLLPGLGMLLAHCMQPWVVRLPGHDHLWGTWGAPYTSGPHSAVKPWLVPRFLPSGSPLKSLVPQKSQCGRKSCQPRLQMLIVASHQPATSSWTVCSLKATACFSGCLLHHVTGESIHELFIEWPEFLPIAGGCQFLSMCPQIHSPGCSMGSGAFLHQGPAWPAAIGLLSGVVLVFGQAPPIGVSWCWLSPLLGGLRELKGWEGR